MLATIINSVAVILGAALGLLFRGRVRQNLQDAVLNGAGILTLIIGIIMAFRIERVLYMAISLILGGIIGSALGLERRVLALGEGLKRLLQARSSRQPAGSGQPAPALQAGHGGDFARGFMESSVLFCAGSMAILGSIQAAMGDYVVLLTKSVLDGFMAIVLASSLGLGVAFSALSILVYQGIITLGAGLLQGSLDPLVLSSISGCGGALVIMIGLGLLGLKRIPSADFLPALVIVVVFSLLDPWIPAILKG